MTDVVVTLRVDQAAVLTDVAAAVEVRPDGWFGCVVLPAGSPWLDPDLTYQFHADDGRWGDVRLTSRVPEVVESPTTVTFVGRGPFTTDA